MITPKTIFTMASLLALLCLGCSTSQCTSTPSKGFVYSQTAEELMAKMACMSNEKFDLLYAQEEVEVKGLDLQTMRRDEIDFYFQIRNNDTLFVLLYEIDPLTVSRYREIIRTIGKADSYERNIYINASEVFFKTD